MMKRLLILLGALLGIYLIVTIIINLPQKSVTKTESTFESTTSQTSSQVKKEDMVIGTGTEAKVGDKISVNYVGSLENGTVFDKNEDTAKPFTFTLGKGEVIRGWDTDVVGMKVGGKRKLIIPADLAYGSQQVGSIPPNSTLIFEVTLLNVEPSTPAAPNPGVNF